MMECRRSKAEWSRVGVGGQRRAKEGASVDDLVLVRGGGQPHFRHSLRHAAFRFEPVPVPQDTPPSLSNMDSPGVLKGLKRKRPDGGVIHLRR